MTSLPKGPCARPLVDYPPHTGNTPGGEVGWQCCIQWRPGSVARLLGAHGILGSAMSGLLPYGCYMVAGWRALHRRAAVCTLRVVGRDTVAVGWLLLPHKYSNVWLKHLKYLVPKSFQFCKCLKNNHLNFNDMTFYPDNGNRSLFLERNSFGSLPRRAAARDFGRFAKEEGLRNCPAVCSISSLAAAQHLWEIHAQVLQDFGDDLLGTS